MNNREDTHLLSGAYALHAVTPDEALLVEAAMRDSDELHGEIVGLTDTAVALGLALPPVAPPPGLRSRLLAAIDDLPQEPAEPDAATDFAVPVSMQAEHASPAPTTAPVSARLATAAVPVALPAGVHGVPRRRRRVRPAAWLAVAAAAVLLFTGGFFVQRTLITPETGLTSVLQASDVHTQTADVTGGGKATVYWSSKEHSTAVVLDGVTAPSGKVLQLWAARNGTVSDAGLYQPQSDGNYVLIAGTPKSGEVIMVSVEPAGGSTHPTTQPIAALSV